MPNTWPSSVRDYIYYVVVMLADNNVNVYCVQDYVNVA